MYHTVAVYKYVSILCVWIKLKSPETDGCLKELATKPEQESQNGQ